MNNAVSLWDALPYIAVMAGVTYAVRMLPFVLFRRKITSPFVRDFLAYVPYAVLAAMTIPGVFSATEHVASAVAGAAVAIALSLCRRSLLLVALAASAAALAVELLYLL